MDNNPKILPHRSHSIAMGGAAACLALASGLAMAAPGDLDASFGSGGKVVTSLAPGSIESADLALQPDGKIIQVGSVQDANFLNDALLLRYNVDGSLDATFGTGGKVTTDYGQVYDGARAVKVLGDGRILTAGSATSQSNTSDMVVARYNSNGSLDASFGANGMAVVAFGAGRFVEGNALVMQGDGKIIVAGRLQSADGGDFALARLLPDGSLDGGFGAGGKVSADFGGIQQNGLGAALQSNGKILVAGYNKVGNGEVVAIARFNTDGSVDTSFGQNGLAVGNFGDQYAHAYAIAVQPDDAIVITGNRGQSLTQPYTEFCMAARFGKDGVLDSGFGTSGVFTGGAGACQGVALAGSGQLLLVGSGGDQANFLVYRLNANGGLDGGFGSNGKALIGFDGSAFVFGNSVALTGDGKAVVSGGVFGAVGTDLGLARLAVGASAPSVPPVTTVSPSITINAPSSWRVGKAQRIAWTSQQIDGKRSVKIQFSKNGGAKFATLKSLLNKVGKLTWKPAKAHITQQGVLKVCVKPTDAAAELCNSANVVVLAK